MPIVTYSFISTPYNFDALDIELDTAFGVSYSANGGLVSRGTNAFDVMIDDSVLESTVQTVIIAHDPNILTTQQKVADAKTTIKALADKADNQAQRIALCFAAILESENLGEDANATFTRITNALNDAIVNNGYRTAVMTAFTAKTGLSFDFGNLGIVILTTKQSFNNFSADFFTRWAFMVDLR